MEQLCRTYWYPIYAFARRIGCSPHDAEDATQGFFTHFLAYRLATQVAPEKGKFRSFLLVAFKNFLATERDRARCEKRGGGREIVSFDTHSAEQRFHLEPVDLRDPEAQYELSWAMALLDNVLGQLEQDFVAAGKAGLFAALRSHLLAEPTEQTYAAIADRFDLTETAVKGTVHRMRRRYRELFREQMAHTIDGPEELDAELRHLLAVVSRR